MAFRRWTTRLALLPLMLTAGSALAETQTVEPTEIIEWKAVYGRVEARDTVPARARIGGTVEELSVSEGDTVSAGQKIALVRDEKIAFQIEALDAQIRATESRLQTAEADFGRTEALVKRGVATAQRLEQLQNDVAVARNTIASLQAQRSVLVKQDEEGAILAPVSGRILAVPVTRGAVIMGGESIASIGGGGFFLRLAIPERHAGLLEQGASLKIATGGDQIEGRLAKVYPQIENGRVVADVEVGELDTAFVDARILVEVPVGRRLAILAPRSAILTRSGIDFVRVEMAGAPMERAVVVGRTIDRPDGPQVEIVSGLFAGDRLIVDGQADQ